MRDTAHLRPSYDVALMFEDLALRGWRPSTLARKARVSDMTVSRFLRGEAQSSPTAKKLAKALGHSVRRYLISSRAREAVA